MSPEERREQLRRLLEDLEQQLATLDQSFGPLERLFKQKERQRYQLAAQQEALSKALAFFGSAADEIVAGIQAADEIPF